MDGPLLPLCERTPLPPPRSALPQQRPRDTRPRLIRARPLGESIELHSASEDSHSHASDDDGRCRIRGCGRGAVRGLHRFVAAAREAIQGPPSELEDVNDGAAASSGGGGGDGNGGGDGTTPWLVSVWEGTRQLMLVLTWEVIHPDSKFRSFWDYLIVFALMYVAFVTTYLLCFEYENPHLSIFEVLDLVVYVVFLLDIAFNFRTAVRRGHDAVSRREVLTSRRVIAVNYLTGWFAVDVLAALPWGGITSSLSSYMQLLKLLRLIRVARLMAVSREMQRSRLYMDMEQTQGAAALRVVCYVVGGLLVLHMSACAWFFVAGLQDRHLSGTWAAAAGLQDAGNFERYLTSLYFVVITYTTVGYGDVFPVTTSERFMTCVGMLIGVVTLGYIISTANTIAGAANKYEIAKGELLDGVDDFLNAHSLPTGLAARVKSFYTYVATKQFNDPEDDALVADLPCDLRRQVLMGMHSRLIARLTLLRSVSVLHEGLVLELTARLKLEFYGKGEAVVAEGGWDTELYFVTEGRLQVRQYRTSASGEGEAGWGPEAATLAPPSQQPQQQDQGPQQQQTQAHATGSLAAGGAASTITITATSRGQASSSAASFIGRLLAGVQARDTRGDAVLEMFGGSVASAQPAQPTAAQTERGGSAAWSNGGAHAEAVSAASAHPGSGARRSGAGPSAPPATAANDGATPVASSLRKASPMVERRRKWRMSYDCKVPYRNLRLLQPGDYFGEYGCLTGCPRTASVIATRMTEVYALKRTDLAAAMARWPGLDAAWKRCEAYRERERERLRLCLQGGRAPRSVSLSDASPAHSNRGDGGGDGGGGGDDDDGGPYDMAAEAAISSHKRYQDFVSYFGGGSSRTGGGGGPDEPARAAMSVSPPMSAAVSMSTAS